MRLFRWQAASGIESRSQTWRLLCVVSNSCLPEAPGRCGDMERSDTENSSFEQSINLHQADLL